jgi:hypothetical protein
MSFFRKAKKAASNAPRVTDKAEQPSGEQQSRVVRQPKAAETSSSSPTGVADEACERSGSSSSSSTSGGVDATRANSATTTTTPAAGGDDGAGAEQGSPSPLGRALRQCKKFSRARKPAAPPSGSS